MGSDPINGGISLTGGGRLAARSFLRTGLGLMCRLAGHDFGFKFILAAESASGARLAEAERGRLEPPSATRTTTKECNCRACNEMGSEERRCYNRCKSNVPMRLVGRWNWAVGT